MNPTMYLQRRPSGLALALASFALSLSCGSSGSSSTGTGGTSPAGSGGVSGPAGSGGTTSAADTGGTTSAADTGGTTSAAGTGGTTSAADTGGTTNVGGSGGTMGASGSSGTVGTGGSVGGRGGNAARGGRTGNAGGGGLTGAGGTVGGRGGNTATGGANGGGETGGGATGGGADAGGGAGGGGGAAGAAGTGGGGTLGPSVGCGTPTGLQSGRASIDVSGKTREYILALPDDYDPSHPYKLIFGWHPWGGSAQQIASGGYFGLASVINGQAILVAPEGQDYQDNGLGWGNANGEDVDFLHAMLERFGSELCIDQDRIFSTGFSFGAMFSFTLACTQDSMMRAIAPQAGNATTSGRCENGTRSVATMAFIGSDDTLLSGHRQAVQIFVERNGCSTQTTTMQSSWCDGLGSNNQPCTCVEYQGCKDGYPVIECEYKAGHQFAPNAGATMWDFFSQF
ncbi:MAG: Ricin and poly(3-hydroxybutyrate) depolymerase fusion [Polyangiaceae bacterium]|nr:Ricin and poly(3-hydroxybutyrate) depolymerase fusion [Polyangiaceae bacterium]